MEKREKTAKILRWVVFALAAVLFLLGLLAELLIKIRVSADMIGAASYVPPPEEALRYGWNRVMLLYGEEAVYFWTTPIFVLKIMAYRADPLILGLLRWIPYFLIFLLPVIAAPLKKGKQIPLLIAAGFSLLEGAGLLLTAVFGKMPLISWDMALPYFIEALLLILLCVALWTKSLPFAIVVGVLFVLFALFSPLTTAILSFRAVGSNALLRMPLRVILTTIFRGFWRYTAASPWPLFKCFSLPAVALIAFTAPAGFPKKTK